MLVYNKRCCTVMINRVGVKALLCHVKMRMDSKDKGFKAFIFRQSALRLKLLLNFAKEKY